MATTQVPFLRGGAEIQAEGLCRALRTEGHEVDLVTLPFRFAPAEAVRRSMLAWGDEDFATLTGGAPDVVIPLRFPAFYLRHPCKVVWLIHQFRAVYELWESEHDGGLSSSEEGRALRASIIENDGKALGEARALFAESARVAERLLEHNGLHARPLYHPPAGEDEFYRADPDDYVFFPSRLESLKRQDLLVEAMSRVRSPVVALLAGEGGMRPALEAKIAALGLEQRVRLLGRVGREELLGYYAHALAVFFAPFDEDYGYVTLEAALSGKPLITCSDSGGVLELVEPDETALVADPEADAIAEAIDRLHGDRARARAMGAAAHDHYRGLEISWARVVETLLEAAG